jgi:hypothetical protein
MLRRFSEPRSSPYFALQERRRHNGPMRDWIKEQSPGSWIWDMGGIRRGPVATREAAEAIDAIMQAGLEKKGRWPSKTAVMDALRAMPELEGKVAAPADPASAFGGPSSVKGPGG